MENLIKLGNVLSLEEKINNDSIVKDNVANANHRDLKEVISKQKPMLNNNINEFNEILFDTWLGYIYLYDEKKQIWLYDDYFINKETLTLKPLSDYFKTFNKIKKPKAPIIGADGNVFNLIAICSRELKKAGYSKQATEMTNRVMKAKSYDDALAIMFEYIEPVDAKGKSFEETDFFDEDIYI